MLLCGALAFTLSSGTGNLTLGAAKRGDHRLRLDQSFWMMCSERFRSENGVFLLLPWMIVMSRGFVCDLAIASARCGKFGDAWEVVGIGTGKTMFRAGSA